jgi:hypothetical protein
MGLILEKKVLADFRRFVAQIHAEHLPGVNFFAKISLFFRENLRGKSAKICETPLLARIPEKL